MRELKLFDEVRGIPCLFDILFDNYQKNVFFDTRQKPATLDWDEEKEEGNIIIEAPGFVKDEIKIESNSDGILIKGEIKDEKIKEKIGMTIFSYILKRNDVDPNSISATLENGLLKISFKKEKDKRKKIVEIV